MAYTTASDVLNEVVSGVPSGTQALIPDWITAESRYVDSALVNYTVPFSDPVPAVVERATRFLVADRVLRKVGLLRYDEAGRVVESYKLEGERILRQLRDGELVIPAAQIV